MKYKITILQGFDVLLTGEFNEPPKGRIVNPIERENDLDKVVFDIEHAINANTSIRAHIERAE